MEDLDMGCDKEPEQLDLGLDSYDTFKNALLGLPGRPGPLCLGWRRDAFNPAVAVLSTWAKVYDLVSCATWTKKLLLHLTRQRVVAAHSLVLAFGHAFRGNEVGALGRDIVEFSLKQDASAARLAAIEVLERWLEDDEDGVWLDLLNDHIDWEPDRQLKSQCVELVQQVLDELDEDEEDPPELEEFLAVQRSRTNRARALLETAELPRFLEKVLEVDQRLTLAVLESTKIGKLVVDDNRYGFLLSRAGGGWQLRAWRTDGSSCFSVEPTATQDRWLVFTRY